MEKNGTKNTKRFAKGAVLFCPDCKNEVYGNVCKNCGLVLNSSPIVNLPSRVLEEDINKQNEGWKWSYSDIEDSTIHSKKTSSPELKKAFKREYVSDSKFGRKYLNGYYEIKRICDYLRFNENISNTAIYLLRTLIKREYMSKSRQKYATFAALVIIGARLEYIPFSYEQIYEYTDEVPKSIKNSYRAIVKGLGLKMPKFTLIHYLHYHCNLLRIGPEQKKEIIWIAQMLQANTHMSGKDPVGYSAAIIRHVTGLKRRYLSKKLYVSEPVITWRYNEIKRLLK